MKRLLFIAFLLVACIIKAYTQENTGNRTLRGITFANVQYFVEYSVSSKYDCTIQLKDSAQNTLKVSRFNILKDLEFNVESRTYSYSDYNHTFIFDRLRRLGAISVIAEYCRFEIYLSRPDLIAPEDNPFNPSENRQ